MTLSANTKIFLKRRNHKKNTNLNARTDFLLEFLQLLGRHTAQFFCRALAALRIVEIITKLTHCVKCNEVEQDTAPYFLLELEQMMYIFSILVFFCIYASKIHYFARFFDYDKII